MREGFKEIVSGWTLIKSVEALDERLQELTKWLETNHPMQEDESATVRMMIETQVLWGIERGDFEPYFTVMRSDD